MKSQLKTRTAILPIAIGIALVAAGCSSSAPSGGGSTSGSGDETIVLRGVAANTSDPFWTSMACAASKEAEEKGYDLKWYSSKGTDSTELNTNFQAALLDNPQGLILDSPTVQQFAAQVGTLQAKGVPVSVVVPMDPPPYNTIVGNQDAPQEVIDMGAEVLKDGGSVFTVGGSAAVPLLVDRYRKLNEELGKLPGVTILPVQFTDFDPTKTQVAVESAILSNPDLKLIVASTGPETIGVLAALQAKGRQDIKVISSDAVPQSVEALRAGKILAIVSTPVGEMGEIQVNELADFISSNGTNPITEPTETTIKVGALTQENIDDPENAGLIYKATCDE